MGIWYQCTVCIFGSNSSKKALEHANDLDHYTYQEDD